MNPSENGAPRKTAAPQTMKLADRVARLGTETAFAVSAEAAAHAAKGNRVFPFHLGDMNLPTPANIQEAAVRALEAFDQEGHRAAGVAPDHAHVREAAGRAAIARARSASRTPRSTWSVAAWRGTSAGR